MARVFIVTIQEAYTISPKGIVNSLAYMIGMILTPVLLHYLLSLVFDHLHRVCMMTVWLRFCKICLMRFHCV